MNFTPFHFSFPPFFPSLLLTFPAFFTLPFVSSSHYFYSFSPLLTLLCLLSSTFPFLYWMLLDPGHLPLFLLFRAFVIHVFLSHSSCSLSDVRGVLPDVLTSSVCFPHCSNVKHGFRASYSILGYLSCLFSVCLQ